MRDDYFDGAISMNRPNFTTHILLPLPKSFQVPLGVLCGLLDMDLKLPKWAQWMST